MIRINRHLHIFCLLPLFIVAPNSFADEKFDFSAIQEVTSENFAIVKGAMDAERKQFMSGKPMNLTPEELKERQRVSVLIQKHVMNPQDPNYKNLGKTKMGTVEDMNEASERNRVQRKAEAIAKKKREAEQRILGEFAGKWVSWTKKGGENIASLYKLKAHSRSFNAELTTYKEIRGQYKKKDTLPLGWQYSGGAKKIHVKYWDEKKTVYWDTTWEIKKWNQEKGRLEVVSKITGAKDDKGAEFTLRKCGSPSVQESRHKKLFNKLCS